MCLDIDVLCAKSTIPEGNLAGKYEVTLLQPQLTTVRLCILEVE